MKNKISGAVCDIGLSAFAGSFFYFLGGIFVNARILKDILDGWGKVSMPQSAVRRNSTYAKEFGWHMDESFFTKSG